MDYFLGVIKGVPLKAGWNRSFKKASRLTDDFVEKLKLTNLKPRPKEMQGLKMYP